MKRILTLSLLMLVSLGVIKAQEKNNYPFQNGERVDFVISYAWGGVITDVASMNLKTLYENGEYRIDFDDLEEKLSKSKPKKV